MSIQNRPIRELTDIFAWQESHKLVLLTYKITGASWGDRAEISAGRMRRTAKAVTNNIVESCGRSTYIEKIQCYYLAQGSLANLKQQIRTGRKSGHIKGTFYKVLDRHIDMNRVLLQGLIKKSKAFMTDLS